MNSPCLSQDQSLSLIVRERAWIDAGDPSPAHEDGADNGNSKNMHTCIALNISQQGCCGAWTAAVTRVLTPGRTWHKISMLRQVAALTTKIGAQRWWKWPQFAPNVLLCPWWVYRAKLHPIGVSLGKGLCCGNGKSNVEDNEVVQGTAQPGALDQLQQDARSTCPTTSWCSMSFTTLVPRFSTDTCTTTATGRSCF